MKPNLSVVVCTVVFLLAANAAFAQGPLTPPGPPAPLMKTLDQIEPRIPISSLPFTINAPGSYYVTTNLVGVAGQNGITINAQRVTLDLMGFEVRGVGGSLSGIFTGTSGLHIRNGIISGWGAMGINAAGTSGTVIEELRISGSGNQGLSVGSGNQVRKCVVQSNGGNGISAGGHMEITDCSIFSNIGAGIQATENCSVRNCAIVANLGTGIQIGLFDGLSVVGCNVSLNNLGVSSIGQSSIKDSFVRSNTTHGITVGTGSNVQGCTASDNGTNGFTVDLGSTVQGCIARNNRGSGIVARNATSVINCSARFNSFDNIQVDGDCIVRDNTCDNATALSGVGIRVLSSDNRIENNNITDSRAGLRIDSAGNLVANNSVRNNNTNYVIANGNQLNLLLGQLPLLVSWPATVKLAGTLTGTGNTNGITIASDNVTVDLGGHSLVGAVSSFDGIFVLGSHTNITICNGTVAGWPGSGVNAGTAANSQVRNLTVSQNDVYGIIVGEGGLVEACNVRTNGTAGIATQAGSRVINCTASRNFTGISLGVGGVVSGAVAYENAEIGISGGVNSLIQNCTAYSNGTNGISIATGGQVVGCNSRVNAGHGIQASSSSSLLNNTCPANTFAGIFVTGTANRIDGNHCTGAQRGFLINGTDNLIIRNSSQGASVLAYDIVAGNHDAARITSPGAAFASTSPWANFSF